jgi:hypothetical protein
MRVDEDATSAEDVIRGELRAHSFNVVAVATDADPGTNRRHRLFFELYEDAILMWTLDEIVDGIAAVHGEEKLNGMPVTDMLHLFKAIRRRLEDHALKAGKSLRGPGGCEITSDVAETLYALVPSAEDKTQHTGFQDGPALQLCQLSVVLAALDRDQEGLARFLAPWALIEAAVREEHLSRELRRTFLQMAFSMLAVAYHEPQPRARLADAVPFFTKQQAIRGMNLCLVLSVIITGRRGPLNMGRIGSHVLEMHFGLVRAALHGDDHLDRWVGAESASVLIANFISDLELPVFRRCTRVSLAGVDICAAEEEDAAPLTCRGRATWRSGGCAVRR